MSRRGRTGGRAAVIALTALLVPAATVEGQPQREGQLDRAPNTACTDAIPASALSPAIAYVVVDTPPDVASLRGRPAAQEFAARVASRIRSRMSGGSTELGFGEPQVTWRGARDELTITAFRDGRLEWVNPRGDSVASAGVRLFAAEVIAAHDSGARIAWPASVVQDAMTFTFRLTTQDISPRGVVTTPKDERLEPLFKVMQPTMEPAVARSFHRPEYPEAAKRSGVGALIQFNFVVDTSGRAEMNSLAMAWPAEPRGAAGQGGVFRPEFTRAVREFMKTARFTPARIGGCPVRMNVRQRFDFRISP